jgi:hypothetical protein
MGKRLSDGLSSNMVNYTEWDTNKTKQRVRKDGTEWAKNKNLN